MYKVTGCLSVQRMTRSVKTGFAITMNTAFVTAVMKDLTATLWAKTEVNPGGSRLFREHNIINFKTCEPLNYELSI